ncbi:MAG: DNA-protecting protein DprA [Candidatus Omnitrophica bacterium CG11_big_fil_rev_8_21_14_0_20_43_6]|nr:MAG: DNA-protecting protein DprA [Candidatus Omnitrophica bacterium CG11_big_fil_rev_8_21_14_0_20_43_6]
MNNFEALVSLNLIPQIGSVRLNELLKHFGQPLEIFKAKGSSLAAVVGERLAGRITGFDPGQLEYDLALAKKSGVRIITFLDPDYPPALKEIPAYPIVLYCSGRILEVDHQAIGIVGSRRSSLYGLNQAESFAVQLSQQGLTIVSGMARGVDTYAHRGALKAGGRTIAVLGSGFNRIYPQENAELAQQIATCGAVISEFPMNAEPLPVNFPRRNRLISGLSLGVLITEAARNSGALITADFALEQGREVFALPGRIDAVGSMGTNALLKQGAKIVTCCDDILEELNLVSCGVSRAKRTALLLEDKITTPGEDGRLYEYITHQPTAIDDLILRSGLSSSQVLNLILKLQFKKLIKTLPGKQFIRS